MLRLHDVIKKVYGLEEEKQLRFFNGPFLVLEYEMDKDFSPTNTTDRFNVLDVMMKSPEAKELVQGKLVVPLSGVKHCLIGRDVDDVVLKNNSISRKHASITVTPKGYMLSDLGSANGTTLNGEAIAAMHGESLKDRDRISFGEVEATYFEAETFKNLVDEVIQRLKKRVVK